MPGPQQSARDAAVAVVRRLVEHGHVAYLAGGCVRDALLGKDPKDYDVATDAPPKQVRKLFRNSAAVGEAFGVILVYVPHSRGGHRHTIEVATFRAEAGYSDGRRPDQIRFTDAEEDAKRRDFTINGLFAQPPASDAPPGTPDRVIDFVGGQQDLADKLIRAIGDPCDRFGEDYLRMLRAVRFAARLNFEIDGTTSAAIRVHARYLGQISRERVGQEIRLMLTGAWPTRAIGLLQAHKLDGPTLNEDPADPPLTISEKLSVQASYPCRLAAWLLDRHGQTPRPQRIIDRWRKAIALSNEVRDQLKQQLDQLHGLKQWREMTIAMRKRHIARDTWPQVLLLYDAVYGNADQLSDAAKQYENDGIGIQPTPLITGDQLIDLGLPPGPKFRDLLDRAYDLQLEGKLTSTQQTLYWVKNDADS